MSTPSELPRHRCVRHAMKYSHIILLLLFWVPVSAPCRAGFLDIFRSPTGVFVHEERGPKHVTVDEIEILADNTFIWRTTLRADPEHVGAPTLDEVHMPRGHWDCAGAKVWLWLYTSPKEKRRDLAREFTIVDGNLVETNEPHRMFQKRHR